MSDIAYSLFDLLGYIKTFGAEESQHNEWVLPCPICRKTKLVVNTKKRTWHCWVCQRFQLVKTPTGPVRQASQGAGGLIDLIQLLEKCDYKTARAKILSAGSMAKELQKISKGEFVGASFGTSLPLLPIAPPPFWKSITEYLPYMRERGISMMDASLFGLLWCNEGKYENRLIFPVWESGSLVYWQARAMWAPRMGERYVKALNPPKTPGQAVSSDVLFNLDTAKLYPRVVLTEGPVDAIHVGPEAVCSFGKRLSPIQIAKLWRAGVKAIDLMWDHDAKEDMNSMAPILADLFDLRMVYLPFGDPGSWRREDLAKLREQAIPVRRQSKLGVL